MGRVFKALSKSEREAPSRSFAAVVTAEEESESVSPREEGAGILDFVPFSMSATALENNIGTDGARVRRGLAMTTRQVTLNASRIDPHLVTFYDFDPRAADEYHKTAVTLISAAADRTLRRVLVASVQHGDGRTSVLLNLACALAQAKQRVLVIDTDLQRPSVLRLLGVDTDSGIAEAISSNFATPPALLKVMPYGFNVLPLRTRVENSAEILASPMFRALLNDSEDDYDFMLFDSPPLLESKDINLLARLTHAMVMVMRPGKTTAGQVASAIATLNEDAVLGVVLNRCV